MRDPELDANPEVNYVLIINKGPVLLLGALLFGAIALKLWDEWTKLSPTESEEE